MVKKLLFAAFALMWGLPAFAQNTAPVVVPSCSTAQPYPTGGRGTLTVDGNGNLCIGGAGGGGSGSSPGALSVVSQDQTISGNLTATNQAITLTGLNGQSSVAVQLGGTFVGTAVVEYSKDNFATVKTASAITPTGISNAGQTAPGFYRYIGIAGYPQARIRVSAYTSGTIAAVLTTSTATDGVPVVNAIPQAMQVMNTPVYSANVAYTSGAAITLPAAGGVQFQVAGINADTLTITQSLDCTNYVPATLLKQDTSQSATGVLTGSTTNGIYSVLVFGGCLKITHTGSADTGLTATYRSTN